MRNQIIYKVEGQYGENVKYYAHKPDANEILMLLERNNVKSAALYKEDARDGWVKVRELM